MRPSRSAAALGQPRSTWVADRRLLLLATLLITAVACVASYMAGLHNATSQLKESHAGTVISVRHLSKLEIPSLSSTSSSSSSSSTSSSARSPPSSQQLPSPDNLRSTPSTAHYAPTGRHILLEYYKIPAQSFLATADTNALRDRVASLVKSAGMTYLGQSCHVFPGLPPRGVTCVFLLSESHLSIHTWPEHGYAALDIFTCGVSAHPEVVEQGLRELLQPGLVVRQEEVRGGLNLSSLSPTQQRAKVLHTFTTNSQDGESVQQKLHQVPILHSSRSRYQSITVVEVPDQMGRCLLLDGVIQFCSHDLDAYTDHMARHPLQLLQALRGCYGTYKTAATAKAAQAGAAQPLVVPRADMPVAASSSSPGHITCRASLLWPQQQATTGAAAGAQSSKCQPPKQAQDKLRVLLVGGGDGWIAEHLVSCYGDLVGNVTAVELDKAVSDVTVEYFGQSMKHGSPFLNPRIAWHYTDAFDWVMQKAAQAAACTAAGAGAGAATATAAGMPGNQTLRRGTSSIQLRELAQASDCGQFDVVIIDSTDFTVTAASKLHEVPFYRALYQLMQPQPALVQIVEIYLRVFEESFAGMEAALRQAGWSGVGRSSVYTPSYGGEALMLHAVKQ